MHSMKLDDLFNIFFYSSCGRIVQYEAILTINLQVHKTTKFVLSTVRKRLRF